MIIPTILSLVSSERVLFLSEFITDDFNNSQYSSWTFQPNIPPNKTWISQCGSKLGNRLLGGYRKFMGSEGFSGANLIVSRPVYGLPPHWSSKLQMQIWKIDSWNGPVQKLQVRLDGNMIQSFRNWTSCSGVVDLCGSNLKKFNVNNNHYSFNDQIINFSHNFTHSSSAFLLSFHSNHFSKQSGSWGLRKFNLYLDTCHPSCLSCSGPTHVQCLSCYTSNTLNAGQCRCNTLGKDLQIKCGSNPVCSQCVSCPSNKFIDTLTTFCQSCIQGCASCSSTNICLSCPNKYHYDGSSACLPCISNCQTCSSSSICSSCISGYVLNGGGTSCNICIAGSCTNCITGSWLNINTCSVCNVACSSCISNNIRGCLSCSPNYFYHQNSCLGKCPKKFTGDYIMGILSCVKICPDGKAIYNPSRPICLPCHTNCKTCQQPNDHTLCQTCNLNFFLLGTSCLTSCPLPYVSNSMMQTCVLPNENLPNKKWIYPICPIQCTSGSIYDKNLRSCQPCRKNCATCVKQHVCTSCRKSLFLHKGKCKKNCPKGRFRRRKNRTCAKKSQCGIGFYPDKKLQDCMACFKGCYTCSGPSLKDCISPAPGYLTVAGVTKLSCSSGTYYCPNSDNCQTQCSTSYLDIPSNSFLPCPNLCLSCSSASICTSCLDQTMTLTSGVCALRCVLPNVNNNGQCLSGCQRGQYQQNQISGDSTSKICMNCHQSCQTCAGPLNNQCITCAQPFAMQFGTCIQTCSGSNLIQQTSQGYQCVAACALGYVFQDGICTSCDPTCATCNQSSDNGCLTCYSGYVLLTDHSCMTTCPIGNYLPLSSTSCSPCILGCGSCQNSSDCLACDSQYLLNKMTGLCVQNCIGATFATLDACQKCQEGCLICTSIVNCQQCDIQNFSLLGSFCVKACPLTTFRLQNICNPCSPGCQICQNSQSCIVCKDNGFKLLQDKTCGCQAGVFNRTTSLCDSCVQGYFLQNKVCIQCHVTCKTCKGNGADSCISCLKNRGDSSNNPVKGVCDCWPGLSNYADGSCNVTSVQNLTTAAVSTTMASALIVGLVNRKRVLLYKFMDFAQVTGTMTYMNVNFPLSSRNIMNTLNNLNLSPLQGKSSSGGPPPPTVQKRGLVQLPPQLLAQGKSQLFLINAAILIGLTLFSWATVLIIGRFQQSIRQMEDGWIKYFLELVLDNSVYALPIQIFLRTFMDGSVNMFLQLANPSWSFMGAISFVVALLFLIYAIGLLVFFVNKINLGTIHSDPNDHKKYSSLILQMGVNLNKAAYFWTLVQCIRKILSAAFIVLLYSKPILQLSLILSVNLLCLIFCLFYNPFVNFMYRLLAIIMQTTGVTLMVVLLAYQFTTNQTLSLHLGQLVQAHLLLQIAIQFLFIGYFMSAMLICLKVWIMKRLNGQESIGMQQKSLELSDNQLAQVSDNWNIK